MCTGTVSGIPSHLAEIIKSFYDNFTCCVGDGDILFEFHTGVRQGCVMSTLLFNLVVDWIMWRTTEDQIRGIRYSFNMMNKIRRSSTYSTRTCTRVNLYHSCVLTTLLHGSECWCLTENDLSKLSTFHTKSLWRILRIFWPNVISNNDLFERCGTEPMATILRRRWRWIGHVTRQEASTAKTALHLTPEGKCKRGRPKITWRRTVEKEMKEMGKTWEGITFKARDRQMWKEHVAALHAT